MKRCFFALAAVLALLPGMAAAGEQLASSSYWVVSGNAVTLRYTFPREIAMHLKKPGVPVITTAAIGRYVLARTSVRQDAAPCAAVDQGYDLGLVDPLYAGPDLYSFEILFHCAHAGGALTLRNDALFDLDRPHVGLANIRVGDAAPVSRLVTRSHRETQIAGETPPAASGLLAYVALGTQHLFMQLVHWCTVCGLFLLARGRRDWSFLAAGILGGYVVAALLSGLGGWVLAPAPADAWDGFLVLLVAALFTARGLGSSRAAAVALATLCAITAAIAVVRGESAVAILLAGAGVFGAVVVGFWPELEPQPARWLIPAGVFGLMDGFFLASAFAPLHGIAAASATHLGAFNFGAALAAFVMCFAAFLVRAAVRRYAAFLARPFFGDLLTAALAATGVFYVVTA